ncbi:hypothetical protein ASE02_21810 [Phenylobacterium sp. Root700]|nr:hypothetical protein ASE02_21810 [Phenylobacterium sp. Root700]
MELHPIHNEAELKAAKAEIARLWNAESDEDVQRLADWAELVDVFEARLIKSARGVDPVAVIQAEMDMNGRSRADLAAVVGQSRATEILNRKRPLTLSMIRAIHRAWDIPADMLIDEYETA